MWQRITSAIVLAFLVLVGIAVYRNLFSDDAAVRVRAEQLARDKLGCAGCTLTRMEGSRGVITETLTYTFENRGSIVVKCRRAYVAFGDYACAAASR